jgi:hypothetical protein
MVKHILWACLAILCLSCDGVEDIINGKAPVLDDAGIQVSADRVAPRDTVIASIKATNPQDGPLTYEWKCDGGDFIPPADSSKVRWVAPLIGGNYELEVKVSNEKRHSDDSKIIYVESSDKPLVDILSPQKGTYFILNDLIPVEASAFHENDISIIRLYAINNGRDSLIQELDGNISGTYSFSMLKAYPALVGQTILKVEAEARNALRTKGSDEVTVTVEGIIEGRNAE